MFTSVYWLVEPLFFKKAKLVYLKESCFHSETNDFVLRAHDPPLHPCLPGVPEILAFSSGCKGQGKDLQTRDKKERLEAAALLPPGGISLSLPAGCCQVSIATSKSRASQQSRAH